MQTSTEHRIAHIQSGPATEFVVLAGILNGPTVKQESPYNRDFSTAKIVTVDINEHFGVPDANIHAAIQSAKRQRDVKLATYVPSRKEILTLPREDLTAILIGWTCHSPIEIVPSRAQIAEVEQLLLKRSDTQHLSALIAMCRNYIRGD